MNPAVEIKDAWKRYSRWEHQSLRLFGPLLKRLFQAMKWSGGLTWLQGKCHRVEALRAVSLRLERGSSIGIIGVNGAGKSTLLQTLAGTLKLSEGSCVVDGRVAALLELGSGFHPDFTGRENVILNAQMLGLSKEQAEARLESIRDFSGIGDFIGQPVRTYSSGMMLRLAFAVVAHVEADLLIIDEALAVGDVGFVQKCMRFIRAFRERGTLIFVSHDLGSVQSLCDRVIWMHDGRVERDGDPKTVTEAYLTHVLGSKELPKQGVDTRVEKNTLEPLRAEQRFTLNGKAVPVQDLRLKTEGAESVCGMEVQPHFEESNSFGKGRGRLTEVRLEDRSGKELLWVHGGEQVTLKLAAVADQPLKNPILGFFFKNSTGQNLFGDNTGTLTEEAELFLKPGDRFEATFHFQMPVLRSGDYSMCAAIASGRLPLNHHHEHWIYDALLIKSLAKTPWMGMVGVPMQGIECQVRPARAAEPVSSVLEV